MHRCQNTSALLALALATPGLARDTQSLALQFLQSVIQCPDGAPPGCLDRRLTNERLLVNRKVVE